MEEPDVAFELSSCPSYKNYTLHRKDRVGQRSGGGDEKINKVFEKANDLVKKGGFSGLLITGYFNYGDIEWDESMQGSLRSNCSKQNKFLESVEESGVYQNVNFKTIQTSNGNLTNTLDLIFTRRIGLM